MSSPLKPSEHLRLIHFAGLAALLFCLLVTGLVSAAPGGKQIRILKLNDRVTVKGNACRLKIQTEEISRIVIRCVPTAVPSAQDSATDRAPKIILDANAKLIVKPNACRLQVNVSKPQRIVIGCGALPGITTRVSVASDGTEADLDSYNASISADGRYVAFDSYADNLVSGDTNGRPDVFVHDNQTGQTMRVSVASDGTPGNLSSDGPHISGNGRYIAFTSGSDNLVSGDTNQTYDTFVHDMQTGQTTRVSVASNGTQANNSSTAAAISGDGRYVAFISLADNLVAEYSYAHHVYIHDMQTGQTTRASVASDGTPANGDSGPAALSADGRYVTFMSKGDNLVSGDTNGVPDIFVRDIQTGVTSRVSVATDGTQANGGSGYYAVSISADGVSIAFDSAASNLVSGDTNNAGDIFVHDRLTGQTTRVSLATDGTQGNGESREAAISGNGRYVAFDSFANNLVQGDANAVDIFLRDMQTGQTVRLSVSSAGAQANNNSWSPDISDSGAYVGFQSWASNLVSGDTNDTSDIFVYQKP